MAEEVEVGTGTSAHSGGGKTAAPAPMTFLAMKRWWRSFLGLSLVKSQARRKLGEGKKLEMRKKGDKGRHTRATYSQIRKREGDSHREAQRHTS